MIKNKMNVEDLLYYECGYNSAICDIIEFIENEQGLIDREQLIDNIKKLEKEK